jgi:hypothetical protein
MLVGPSVTVKVRFETKSFFAKWAWMWSIVSLSMSTTSNSSVLYGAEFIHVGTQLVIHALRKAFLAIATGEKILSMSIHRSQQCRQPKECGGGQVVALDN